MIITRSPLRISLGGGATDLPSYYEKYGGFLIAAAINKYVYTTIHHTPINEICLRYSKIERTNNINEIHHPIIRECLKLLNIKETNIEITSLADLPSGTGLGSSSSFTTSLLKSLYSFKGKEISTHDLAELACHVEMDILKEPIGKQDQFIASYGGVTKFNFNKDGSVIAIPINASKDILNQLEQNLVLISTGFYRAASSILKEQDDKSKAMDVNMIDNLNHIKELGYRSLEAIESGNLTDIGHIFHEHWHYKKQRSVNMSNPDIDKWYEIARNNGAIGCKLCFIPETQIKVENGHKYIKDIIVGEKVFDHQNNLQNVNEVMKRNYNGKILKFSITGLKNPLYVTPEHPLFTTFKNICKPREINDIGKRAVANELLLKEAKFFKKGQCLLIPVDTEIIDIEKFKIERSVIQSKYSNRNIYDKIPEEINVDYDFLNMLGWFIAEGSANHKQFQFSMNANEINDAKIISSLFNDLCGKCAKNKKIPQFVMKLPLKKQAILLSALWKGDGCERYQYDKRTQKKYIRCSYKTVSFKLAKQIQEICYRLGFISSIKEEKYTKSIIIYNNKKPSLKQTSYMVSIDGEDAVAFKNFIDFGIFAPIKRNNNKQLSLKKEFVKINEITYVKRSIRNIEQVDYNGEVFNLNVENSHTYVANDIAVHNCGSGGGGFLLIYTEERNRLLKAMREIGLYDVEFKFDYEGNKILV